ncbi:MAG: FAD:protein FMN transferase, partial [Gammaproteobacteria bacterium]|nr:FAD:protein FMN transferase [Gammaproteobacteria bacterium]
STSGDYERGYVQDGRRFHHILDPATGLPTAGTATALVIATDAELADAASTALMVAGPGAFTEVCAQLHLDHALIVTTGGRLLTTPAMAARLRRDNGGRLPDL